MVITSTNSVFITSAKQSRHNGYKKRSHDCDPTLHKTSTEANYVLVKTRLTNGLRSLKEDTTTLQMAQAPVWNYTTWSMSSSGKRPPSGSVVPSLKHKLRKREYKYVLSKTYVGAILLMHMYQGKGRWGFNCTSASFDLASLVLRIPERGKNIHESK